MDALIKSRRGSRRLLTRPLPRRRRGRRAWSGIRPMMTRTVPITASSSPPVKSQSCRFVLKSYLAPVQFHPVEKVVSELNALLVFEDDESKTFLLLGVPVLRYGDPF